MKKTLLPGVAVTLLSLAAPSYGAAITYNGTGFAIPDNTPAGVSSVINSADVGSITAVTVTLTFSPAHTWGGDLVATLSHGAGSAILFQRVGSSTPGGVGDSSDLAGPYTFADGGASFVAAAAAAASNAAIAPGTYGAAANNFNGTYSTVLLNAVFGALDRSGAWTLHISDNSAIDTTTLSAWSLTVTTQDGGSGVPEPGSVMLVGLGLAAAAFGLRRRG